MTEKEQTSRKYIVTLAMMGCSTARKEDFIEAVRNTFGKEPEACRKESYEFDYLSLKVAKPDDDRPRIVEWFGLPSGIRGHVAAGGFVTVSTKPRFKTAADIEKWLSPFKERGYVPYEEPEKELERETEGMGKGDIPVPGKIYHVFDDGKITWARHFLVRCKEVVPLDILSSDPKYAKVFEAWKNRGCEWLYDDTTDYVAICEDIEDAASERVLHEETWDRMLFYTRTKHQDWFGFGTLLDDGVLDVTRKTWTDFLNAVRSGTKYEYGPDTIAAIEEADAY